VTYAFAEPIDESVDFEESSSMRLKTAAEQIRLAAVALGALSRMVDPDDIALDEDIDRLNCRAAELMRTAERLSRKLGVSQSWGLKLLFHPAADTVELAPDAAPANESIELEPLALLGPLIMDEGTAPPRWIGRPSAAPWIPRVVQPTPPQRRSSIKQDSPLAD